MGFTGNHMIDEDDGSHSSSPLHDDEHSCPDCEGTGYVIMSCCGNDITYEVESNGNDICPTCKEHCGDESEDCERCGGTGEISDDEHYDLHHDY